MATTERVIMMSAEQSAREQLAAEMKALAENPPSETVPGGKYRTASGETVNANGEPLKGAKAAADSEEPEAKAPARTAGKK